MAFVLSYLTLSLALLVIALISIPSVLVSGDDFPVECPYPCLPPPSAVTNCPPPPAPSAPTEPVYGYPPPPPPGAPEYEGFSPPPPGYFPYYTPPSSSSMFPAPPPPNPILPWFPWYYRTPPSASTGRATVDRVLGGMTAIFVAAFASLILF